MDLAYSLPCWLSIRTVLSSPDTSFSVVQMNMVELPEDLDASRPAKRPSAIDELRLRNQVRMMLIGYGISLLLPAIKTNGNFGTIWGFAAFVGSMLALMDYYPYWLANPIFLTGLFFFYRRRWKYAAVCGFAASILALSVPVMMNREASRLMAPPGTISSPLLGYYVWLACPTLLSIFAIRNWFLFNTDTPSSKAC